MRRAACGRLRAEARGGTEGLCRGRAVFTCVSCTMMTMLQAAWNTSFLNVWDSRSRGRGVPRRQGEARGMRGTGAWRPKTTRVTYVSSMHGCKVSFHARAEHYAQRPTSVSAELHERCFYCPARASLELRLTDGCLTRSPKTVMVLPEVAVTKRGCDKQMRMCFGSPLRRRVDASTLARERSTCSLRHQHERGHESDARFTVRRHSARYARRVTKVTLASQGAM